jgi:hypothetical protein
MTFPEITQERFANWADKLNQSNATPVVLVAVGHEQNSGEVVICVPENVEKIELLALLNYTIQELGK